MKPVYRESHAEPLADMRALLSRDPDALYLDSRELAHLLNCTEAEADLARIWISADGLEIAA